MKRKSIAAVVAALLALGAIAGTAFADGVFGNGSNPYCYTCDGHNYGSQQDQSTGIHEPGKTNKTPNHAPGRYYHADDPNNLPGNP